jgi:two-component system response regulator (stage 0 sporulation protein A)
VLNNFFAYTDNRRGRPTNSEFIALVADRLRIGERVI